MSGQRVVAGSIHKCERCGCHLRIPPGVGGLAMVCPDCGERFHTVFRIGPVMHPAENSSETQSPGIRICI